MSGVLSLCRVGNGSWVSEGLQVVSNTTGANSTISVACNSTHLTSFAVLVDVAGGHEVPYNRVMLRMSMFVQVTLMQTHLF